MLADHLSQTANYYTNTPTAKICSFACVAYTHNGSFIVRLLIFFWVGFRWDGHYGPDMGGMDPTCRHPKPRPTNPRDFLTHHYFRTEMESSKSPKILIQRCFQKLCPEPFLELERKGKL